MAVIDRHISDCVTRKTAFGRLWVLGLAGAVAAAAEPLPGDLVASSGLTEGAVRVLTFINSGLLLAAMVALGTIAASNVGLRAHLAPLTPADYRHRRNAFHWVQAGVLMAAGLMAGRIALDLLAAAQMPLANVDFIKTAEAVTAPSLTTRLLHTAVTEELMLRWGLMSGVLWVMFLLFHQEERLAPSRGLVWAAIIISSMLALIGQTPGLMMIGFDDPAAQLLLFNGLVTAFTGIAYGWLFWKHGLEAAILAHLIVETGLAGLASAPWA